MLSEQFACYGNPFPAPNVLQILPESTGIYHHSADKSLTKTFLAASRRGSFSAAGAHMLRASRLPLSETRRVLLDGGRYLLLQPITLCPDSRPVAALGELALDLSKSFEQVDDSLRMVLSDRAHLGRSRVHQLAVLVSEAVLTVFGGDFYSRKYSPNSVTGSSGSDVSVTKES